MLRIKITMTGQGLLRGAEAVGHVGFGPKGSDPVCAAATVLLRTAARTLERKQGIELSGGAPSPGQMQFEILALPESLRGWISGVSEALFQGLTDLAMEFPDKVSVQVERIEEN